jgi:hypothetical protein
MLYECLLNVAIAFNVTKRDYLLAINFTAFLNTFLYYKSSHPARRTSHIIILFSRLNLFINQFDLRGRRATLINSNMFM